MKLAEIFADVLKADIKKSAEIDLEKIADYDLIGFGSGIYNGKRHPALIKLSTKIPETTKQKAFIFSTSTIFMNSMHHELRNELVNKGFKIAGEFNCKGKMTHSFTKFLLSGLNRTRPNKKDLEKARNFAEEIKKRIINRNNRLELHDSGV